LAFTHHTPSSPSRCSPSAASARPYRPSENHPRNMQEILIWPPRHSRERPRREGAQNLALRGLGGADSRPVAKHLADIALPHRLGLAKQPDLLGLRPPSSTQYIPHVAGTRSARLAQQPDLLCLGLTVAVKDIPHVAGAHRARLAQQPPFHGPSRTVGGGARDRRWSKEHRLIHPREPRKPNRHRSADSVGRPERGPRTAPSSAKPAYREPCRCSREAHRLDTYFAGCRTGSDQAHDRSRRQSITLAPRRWTSASATHESPFRGGSPL